MALTAVLRTLSNRRRLILLEGPAPSPLPKSDTDTAERLTAFAIRRSGLDFLWGDRRDLNPRPPGPQPGALPAELRPPCHFAVVKPPRRVPDKHSRSARRTVHRVTARRGSRGF